MTQKNTIHTILSIILGAIFSILAALNDVNIIYILLFLSSIAIFNSSYLLTDAIIKNECNVSMIFGGRLCKFELIAYILQAMWFLFGIVAIYSQIETITLVMILYYLNIIPAIYVINHIRTDKSTKNGDKLHS